MSAEIAPWSKSGGLGDVMDALPVALAARGVSVMSVAPAYQHYADMHDTGIAIPLAHPGLRGAAAQPHESQHQEAAGPGSTAAAHGAATQQAAGGPRPRSDGSGATPPAGGAQAPAGGSNIAAPARGGDGDRHARLHAACVQGVLRVFVQHPLFELEDGHNIYSTYTAAGAQRDVATAMHVMVQGALAAPCLLAQSKCGAEGCHAFQRLPRRAEPVRPLRWQPREGVTGL